MPVVGILKSAKSYTNLPPPPPPPPTHADHYKAYSSKRCDTFFFRINCLKAGVMVIFFCLIVCLDRREAPSGPHLPP